MGLVDAGLREAMLFAAAGLVLGGLDDFAVDLVFVARRGWCRLTGRSGGRVPLGDLPPPPSPGRIAILVPAWDEAGVIGAMLRSAAARLDHPDWCILVGCYPNDPATIAEVRAVAAGDPRIRAVMGDRPGPTTKADNLNTLWRALRAADAREGRETRAVMLHDAEDVVHPAELRVVDSLLESYEVVQLPVLPLIRPGSAMVSGHYADEFAEAHTRLLVVRTALGAGMPLAGTGCAIRTEALARVAAQRGGDPFDSGSLVEDYELGLRLADLGARSVFARVADAGGLVAVRSYFPATLPTSIRQKARWMTGIALAGWDRTGWAGRRLAIGDHWMRMRDRRGPLAVIVLATAYAAAMLLGLSILLHLAAGTDAPEPGAVTATLLGVNALLLLWRLAMRVVFTARLYGLREGLIAVPRFLVGNYVALAAAPRAVARYVALLRGGPLVWDKTAHDFPDLATETPR